ncbi:hypothetical protein NS506_01678 [Nocardia seriolae]|uniref:Uncharacterized protein n=1 Tax=Nocardia seriolae TaxID=37332 RepID=A0ABC9YXP1_9NOCA|nr:hypothetical protein [Nocardia seriolae]GEM25582.1 hypothetical protein NS2_38210 [Nocardia seriolae NBRC 15557]APA95747.1 hypothetical protein NS506_01678 [Nocardia seriolae]MTJ73254.1 hypothetical protein [Nocardia seriolae]MTK46513.1 hypothetical protein [Nocardia seriolae]OJF82800.1 hypothetical protein NS14008_31290 [Nocardia seriolae]
MIRLPDWVKVGAPVRFRMTGRDDVRCVITAVGSSGRITLCNGERFESTDFTSGNRSGEGHFEKINRLSRVTKSMRATGA